ncbi:IS630 family transposase [Bradyrhizobium sp. RDI18]|uniref:IS630 family transposase n=1 Tax=Bradyrhizobium sp. RDI18 TaxID=3367400 RepID=UPI00371A6394
MWCIPHVDGEYVARMEDVLDLYSEAPDPERPLVCFDETPSSSSARCVSRSRPGQRERYDYEYRRNGTVNLFVTFDPHRGWRNVKITDRRAAVDYAHCMRELVDVHYPDAACIRVVQDNLSIHTAGALYQAFAPAEARRILRRLEFHYTPKHASWLNMVECEISVLQRQCLGRRIDDPKRLRKRDRSMATAVKQSTRPHQMDVHNRQSPRQTRPRISNLRQRVKITVMNH